MAECAHKENLLLGDPITGVVFRRFWELLLVCAASLTSGLMWMTYSTAQDTVEGMYPGWKDNSTLPTLALWGPAVSVIGSPAMPLLVARCGLRTMVATASASNAFGMGLRIITTTDPWALIFAHFSMAGAAWAGVVVFAVPGVLTQRWFPPSERHTATAAILASNVAGSMLGFLVGNFVEDESGFRLLLWTELAVSVAFLGFCMSGFIMFRGDRPELPPSLSAAMTEVNTTMDMRTAWSDIKILLSNRDFMALACSMGISQGSFTGWGAVCTPLLKPLGYSEDAANWIGFASQGGCVAGILLGGKIADLCKVGVRGPKRVLLSSMVVSAALFLLFAMATTSTLAAVLHEQVPLCTIITLGSMCIMGSESVFYESAVEALFGKVSAEGIEVAAGAFIAMMFNTVCAFFLVLTSSGVAPSPLTWVPGAACLLAVCILFALYRQPMGRSIKDGLVHPSNVAVIETPTPVSDAKS